MLSLFRTVTGSGVGLVCTTPGADIYLLVVVRLVHDASLGLTYTSPPGIATS